MRRRPSLGHTGLALLFPVSVAWFAAVHAGARVLVLALVALTAIAVLARRGRSFGNRTTDRICIALAAAAWVSSMLAILPAGSRVRALLQPGLAPLVDASLGLVGATTHPLGISPHRVLSGLGFAAGMLSLAAVVSSAIRHRGHLRPMARVLVGTGLALCALGLAHELTGAESIYWVTGIPGYSRSPFFGSFVNPNHAAYVLVAVAPLAAIGLGLERRTGDRLLGLLTTGAIVVALIHIGCRGALVVVALEIVAVAVLAGARWLRFGVTVAALATVVAALATGPEVFVRWASAQVDHDEHHAQLLSRRFEQWNDSLDLLPASPWVGLGAGGYDDAHGVVKKTPAFLRSTHLHQEPLQALLEHGVPSGLLWILALVAPLVAGVRRAVQLQRGKEHRWVTAFCVSGVGILGSTMTDFPLRIGAFAVLAALVLGALLGSRGGSRSDGATGSRALRPSIVAFAILGLVLVVVGFFLRGSAGSVWADAAVLGARADEEGKESPDRAVELMNGAVRAEPLDYYAVIGLGGALGRAGRLDEAASAFEVGTRVAPTLPWAWLHLARLRDREGDWEAAHVAWERMLWCNLPAGYDSSPYVREALSSGPDPLLAARNAIPDRAGRLAEAARLLAVTSSDPAYQEQAEELYLRAYPGGPGPAAGYANFLLKRDRPQEAWDVVSETGSDRCGPLRVGAAALRELGRLEEAELRYQMAKERCPERRREDVAAGLVAVQLELGRPLAVAHAEGALEAEPGRHQLRRKLIRVYLDRPRSTETRERLEIHLGALEEAGVANAREVAQLGRVRQRLPIVDRKSTSD